MITIPINAKKTKYHIRRRLCEVSNKNVQLCHMISVFSTLRKRPVKGNPRQRVRPASFFLRIKIRRTAAVCRNFFMITVRVKNHRLFIICKRLLIEGIPQRSRWGSCLKKKWEKVHEFISKLRGIESHYNRSKSRRIYLPAHFSIKILS